MPIIVATSIRYIIVAGAQLGLWTLAEKYGLPLINSAIEEIIKVFGFTEKEAEDMVANEVLQAFESVGIFALTLRTKLPIKLAEKLGFTTKGWSKRILTGKATAAKEAMPSVTAVVRTGLPKVTAEEANKLLMTLSNKDYKTGLSINFLKNRMNKEALAVMAIISSFALGNVYLKTNQQKFKENLTAATSELPELNSDYDEVTQRKGIIVTNLYDTYKERGALAIKNPYTKKRTPFYRNQFVELLNQTSAEMKSMTGKATLGDVIAGAQLFIMFPGMEEVREVTLKVTEPEAAPTVKIFTGVLTQGKLGAAEPFITRKSDLIDSMQELQQAAGNNLASFILALPGRIIYEIKIVSSVTTKDGFTQRGAARQITTGYTKAGKPKIKTVINKFAIVDVFVFTERNVKTRIQKIVLGPVDSVAFQPKGADLQIAEQSIKANLVTSNVEEIKIITTDSPPPIITPVTPTEVTEATAAIKTAQTTISEEQKQAEPAEWRARQMFATLATTKVTEATAAIETAQRAANVLTSAQQLATVAQQALTVSRTPITQAAVIATQAMVTQAQAIAAAAVAQAKLATLTAQQTVAKVLPTTAPVMITPPAMITPAMPAMPYSNNPNRMNAQSIAEFFDINKQIYPSVSTRSKFYEAYGLGPATWYTGTADQNIKLLAEFKKRYGK